MVVLRLARKGKKKQAFYRIVVADSKRFVNSKFISIVGWYNPLTKEVSLKKDEIATWLEKGAQPSNTVAKILKDNGVKLPDWVNITEKNRKPKKEVVEKPAVEAPSEEVTAEDANTEDEPAAEEVVAEVGEAKSEEEAPAESVEADTDKEPATE